MSRGAKPICAYHPDKQNNTVYINCFESDEKEWAFVPSSICGVLSIFHLMNCCTESGLILLKRWQGCTLNVPKSNKRLPPTQCFDSFRMRAQEGLRHSRWQRNYPTASNNGLSSFIHRGLGVASLQQAPTAQQLSGILKYNNALVCPSIAVLGLLLENNFGEAHQEL